MYNSIPNIVEKKNLFHIDDNVIKISTGSYELDDITDFIYNKLKNYKLENTFKVQSNNNTLHVEITTMRESVYFNKERPVGQLFGFHQKFHQTDQTVNIFKINTIRLECNMISGLYVDNTPNHTLHEFVINVPPKYKMTVTPHNLIYLPINYDEISTLSIRIVVHSDDLVNETMNEILNVWEKVYSNESISKKEFLTYSSYNQTFKPTDEIWITIQNQDLYVPPHESYLNFQGIIRKD